MEFDSADTNRIAIAIAMHVSILVSLIANEGDYEDVVNA